MNSVTTTSVYLNLNETWDCMSSQKHRVFLRMQQIRVFTPNSVPNQKNVVYVGQKKQYERNIMRRTDSYMHEIKETIPSFSYCYLTLSFFPWEGWKGVNVLSYPFSIIFFFFEFWAPKHLAIKFFLGVFKVASISSFYSYFLMPLVCGLIL